MCVSDLMKKDYRNSQGEWPCDCESNFLSELKYSPKVCSETCLQQTFVKYLVRDFFFLPVYLKNSL